VTITLEAFHQLLRSNDCYHWNPSGNARTPKTTQNGTYGSVIRVLVDHSP
jgi:hypothetical protein